jgi:superfamily I DNA/RNA helicase
VVDFERGAAVVVAGPGTGKTHLLVARLLSLLGQPAPPVKGYGRDVLVLTFTRAAARTLLQRLHQSLPIDRGAAAAAATVDQQHDQQKHPPPLRPFEVCTLHSFAWQVVQEHGLELGLGPSPRVLSAAEQALFVSQALHRMPLRRYREAAGFAQDGSPESPPRTRGAATQPQLEPAPPRDGGGGRVSQAVAGSARSRRFVGELLRWVGRLQERGVRADQYQTFVRRWGRTLRARQRNLGLASTAAADASATVSSLAPPQWLLPPQEQPGRLAAEAARLAAEIDRYELAAELGSCYATYEALKREAELLDMGDFGLQLLRLLSRHPAAGRRLAARYEHILVDEFQDLSPVQLSALMRLWRYRRQLSSPSSETTASSALHPCVAPSSTRAPLRRFLWARAAADEKKGPGGGGDIDDAGLGSTLAYIPRVVELAGNRVLQSLDATFWAGIRPPPRQTESGAKQESSASPREEEETLSPSLVVVGDDNQAIFQWRTQRDDERYYLATTPHRDSDSQLMLPPGLLEAFALRGSLTSAAAGDAERVAAYRLGTCHRSVNAVTHAAAQLMTWVSPRPHRLAPEEENQEQEEEEEKAVGEMPFEDQEYDAGSRHTAREHDVELGTVASRRFETEVEEGAWIAEWIHTRVTGSPHVARRYEDQSGDTLAQEQQPEVNSWPNVERMRSYNHRWRDFAVLCRHNSSARQLALQLRSAGVPTRLVGGNSGLLRTQRVGELLHFLAAITQWPGQGCFSLYALLAAAAGYRTSPDGLRSNSADAAFAEVFGLSSQMLSAMVSQAQQHSLPLRRIIAEAAAHPGVAADLVAVAPGGAVDMAQADLKRVDDALTRYEDRVHTTPPSLLLAALLRESGLNAVYASPDASPTDSAEGRAVTRFLHWVCSFSNAARSAARTLMYVCSCTLRGDRRVLMRRGRSTPWSSCRRCVVAVPQNGRQLRTLFPIYTPCATRGRSHAGRTKTKTTTRKWESTVRTQSRSVRGVSSYPLICSLISGLCLCECCLCAAEGDDYS